MTREPTTITCPHCNGNRRTFAFWDGPRESSSGYVDCSTCKGNGFISQQHMDRIVSGKKLRDDRIARGVTLKEEAAQLGIKPVELSAIERGGVIIDGGETRQHKTTQLPIRVFGPRGNEDSQGPQPTLDSIKLYTFYLCDKCGYTGHAGPDHDGCGYLALSQSLAVIDMEKKP